MNQVNSGVIRGMVMALVVVLSAVGQSEESKSQVSRLAGLEINGYFDFYYQASSQAHNATPATLGGPQVVEGSFFERHANQMTMNMAELSLKKKTGRVSMQADLAMGEMVDQLSGGGSQSVTATGGTNSAANESTRNIPQAILTYKFDDRLTFNAGKFYSFLGYETTKAKDNLQYARSFSFNYGVPLWHEGVSGNYVFTPDRLSASFYLLNAWDGRLYQEQNKALTLGASVVLNLREDLALTFNYIGGAESTDTSRRDLVEAIGSYTLSSKITLAADLIYGIQKNILGLGDARWSALDLYLKWQVKPTYVLSPRLEYFDDSDRGYAISGGLAGTGVKQKITSLCVSNHFDLGDGLEARVDLKVDKSDASGFFKDQIGSSTDHQETVTAALLYSY